MEMGAFHDPETSTGDSETGKEPQHLRRQASGRNGMAGMARVAGNDAHQYIHVQSRYFKLSKV